MRVAVLAVDGMSDSGFASVLDGLTTANVLHLEAGLTLIIHVGGEVASVA